MTDVVVIGGANIDIKAKSNAQNKLGTSNPGVVRLSPGGVGRNIAHNLARLGSAVALISVVGQDANGTALVDATRLAGVDVSRVLIQTVATGTYVAILDDDGELVTAMSDTRAIELLSPEMIETHRACLEQARLVVADCNLRVDTLQAIAAIVADKLIVETVSVPKCHKLLEILEKSPVMLTMPNFDQVEHLSKSRDIKTAFAFLHSNGVRFAAIHAGAEGAFISDGVDMDHAPAMAIEKIVDVTGAGDAAVAGLIFGLLQGDSLFAAATRGQQLAARVIASAASTLE